MRRLCALFIASVLLTQFHTPIRATHDFSSHIVEQQGYSKQILLEKLTTELTNSHLPKGTAKKVTGKVSDVVIQKQIHANKREYVFFSYKLDNKQRIGIQVYEVRADGSWSYSTRSSMYEHPETPLEILFNHVEKYPMPIAGIVNHSSIKKIKVNFKEGKSYVLPADQGYFFDVIHRDFETVSSVEGLDSSNKVVSVAWE